MMPFIHPAPILFCGAWLLPLMARCPMRALCLMLTPLLALGARVGNGGLAGQHAVVSWLDWTLVLGRVDTTATIFALAVAVLAVLATLYGLESARMPELAIAWILVAGALGVVYSGDWLSLFCFWSMSALAPAFLVWSGAGPDNAGIGLRHALLQAAGTVVLLVGIFLWHRATGELVIGPLAAEQTGAAAWLIVAGLGMGAAVFPLHGWLPTGCAAASPFGAVAMMTGVPAALHALLRCGVGMGGLIGIGLVGALYALAQALRANDLRRLAAWALITQSGFALAVIGCGNEAFAHSVALHAAAASLAASLLVMAAGALRRAAGVVRLDEAGGLFGRAPALGVVIVVACLALAMAPALGIVALPPAAEPGPALRTALWLYRAAAFCAILVAIRLLFFLRFGRKNPVAAAPAALPLSTRLALALTAALCVLAITAPAASPAFAVHLAHGLELFGLAALAFALLRPLLAPEKTELADIDRLYRHCGRALLRLAQGPALRLERNLAERLDRPALLIRRAAPVWRGLEREWLADAGGILADACLRGLAGRFRRFQRGSARAGLVRALLPAACLALALALHLAR